MTLNSPDPERALDLTTVTPFRARRRLTARSRSGMQAWS